MGTSLERDAKDRCRGCLAHWNGRRRHRKTSLPEPCAEPCASEPCAQSSEPCASEVRAPAVFSVKRCRVARSEGPRRTKSSDGYAGDFDAGSARDRRNLHGLAGRRCLRKISRVDFVDRRVIVDVHQVQGAPNDVLILHPSGLKDGAEILENALRFGFD